jgi:hypothetical protein
VSAPDAAAPGGEAATTATAAPPAAGQQQQQAAPPPPPAPEQKAKRQNPWAVPRARAAEQPPPEPAPERGKSGDGGAERRRLEAKHAKDLSARDAEIARLKPLAEQAGTANESLAAIAKAQLAKLPEKARKTVERIAKTPAAQLDAIAALMDEGMLESGIAAGATTGHDAAKPPPKPSDPDVIAFQNAEKMKRDGDRRYRSFTLMYGDAIERGRQKAGANAATN